MYTLLPLFCVLAAVSSTDLQVGAEGGRIIYDSKVDANPAIWKQVQNLTVNATGNEVISRVVVTDLRPNKDGEVKIVEGGEGQKNVTLELKSPTVLRGFEFQVQVYASPDRKGRETVAETPVESGEVATPVETSVPIANDTVINENAKPMKTDVVNGTAEVPASGAETPIAIEQMKKRDTAPEVNQESQDNEGMQQQSQDTNAGVSNSEDVAQETEGSESEDVAQETEGSDGEDVLSETHDSDSEEMVQEPAVQQQKMKKRDTSDMSQVSQVEVNQSQASVDSQDSQESDSEEVVEEPAVEQTMKKRNTDEDSHQSQDDVDSDDDMSQEPEDDNQDSQESDSEEIVEEPVVQQKKKRDTSNMSQESQVGVDQFQESVDSQEDLSEEDSQESDSEEEQEEQQRKRAAQEMPQIQISGEMPEIQMPDVQLPEIQMPSVQWPEVQISDVMPQVQIGEETKEQPKERAAQETSETEGEVPQENLGEEVPQGEQLPQDPIAQYVNDQNGSNENPIQAPLVPEIMLEENNSTHFNDSAPIVERSPSKYEKETEPPTEPTTTEETTTETPTEEPTTTEKQKKDHHYDHHHNWHDSHGYY